MTILILGLAPTHPDQPGANGGPAFIGTTAGRRLANLAGLGLDDDLVDHYTLRNVWEDPVDTYADLSAGVLAVTNLMLNLEPEVTVTVGRTPARLLGIKTVWFDAQWATIGRRTFLCHAIPKTTSTLFWREDRHCERALALFQSLRGELPAE